MNPTQPGPSPATASRTDRDKAVIELLSRCGAMHQTAPAAALAPADLPRGLSVEHLLIVHRAASVLLTRWDITGVLAIGSRTGAGVVELLQGVEDLRQALQSSPVRVEREQVIPPADFAAPALPTKRV